ncbi:hypothetical protein [Alienimonas californiensis]|nr:hypothetical protein [Alienimonas californiensis]
MSIRTSLALVDSLAPVRAAVACGDRALCEAVVARHAREFRGGDEDEEFREWAEGMLLCDSPPDAEPGAWNYVIEVLAVHFGLGWDDDTDFNEGWKHNHVWADYRSVLESHIPEAADRLLARLEEGRPLRGRQIEHDGCLFSFLTPEEAAELHAAFAAVDADAVFVSESPAEGSASHQPTPPPAPLTESEATDLLQRILEGDGEAVGDELRILFAKHPMMGGAGPGGSHVTDAAELRDFHNPLVEFLKRAVDRGATLLLQAS